MSNSRKTREGKIYRVSRMNSGAKASSWRGEYVAAMVVHARERKTRFRDVDHDESMGIARREAIGTVKGVKRDINDMVVECLGFSRCSWYFLKGLGCKSWNPLCHVRTVMFYGLHVRC
jgi:hypothetical protein